MAKDQGTYVHVKIVTDKYGTPSFHIQQTNIMNENIEGTEGIYSATLTLNGALDRWAKDFDYPEVYVAEL